ncbi:nardilysin-like isoform X3 [Actinidia eriantha]|uniref:nardilysin-like isoform X3 n=1 Tax=Actinidia eriantha TaxID=165200 RepID=UPI00258A4624|nr:nardilysin-like isoform X3 [Actinidia eriantha]
MKIFMWPPFYHGYSQFFISPLVKAEAMEREVLPVGSEFNQVLQNYFCRLQQLQCYTSATDHPFNRFFWEGNKKSLVDAMEKGLNLREQILKVYRDNYHGGLMKLGVIGGETLDVLESWVLNLFNNIKKGPPLKQEARTKVPIWKAGKLYSELLSMNAGSLPGPLTDMVPFLVCVKDGLDCESFENYRSGLIAKLLEKDPSLQYETNWLWGQIIDKRYMFDLSEKKAAELRHIQKIEVIAWYNTYLTQSSPKCWRLAVRVWGCNAKLKEANTQVTSVQVIEDLAAIKISSKFYPSFC